MRGLRLLAWNIRQSGGARLAAIAEAIVRNEADIVVLSEYRGGESGTRLCEALATIGYRYSSRIAPPTGRSGVLIAARRRFQHYGRSEANCPSRIASSPSNCAACAASICRTCSQRCRTGRR